MVVVEVGRVAVPGALADRLPWAWFLDTGPCFHQSLLSPPVRIPVAILSPPSTHVPTRRVPEGPGLQTPPWRLCLRVGIESRGARCDGLRPAPQGQDAVEARRCEVRLHPEVVGRPRAARQSALSWRNCGNALQLPGHAPGGLTQAQRPSLSSAQLRCWRPRDAVSSGR